MTGRALIVVATAAVLALLIAFGFIVAANIGIAIDLPG